MQVSLNVHVDFPSKLPIQGKNIFLETDNVHKSVILIKSIS